MNNLFYFIAVIFFIALGSCTSTNRVYISVQEPAPVTLPGHIQSVAVINRTTPSEKTGALNDIYRVMSLESEALIREGSAATVSGLVGELSNSQRLAEVVRADSADVSSFGAGVFPAPLDWDKIKKICRETRTDAVFSLELFDTESKIDYAMDTVHQKTILGDVPLIEHQVHMNTLVTTGWRMYDPGAHTVLDESSISRNLNFYGKGVNPAAAAKALIGKSEAVKRVGMDAGKLYAAKINPFWLRVHRNYFVRSKNSAFDLAKRKAQTGNWDEAAEIWLAETKNPDPKTAGRAYYNMAIIHEINGQLDEAISWAQKSYENYKIRLGLDYVRILRQRKENEKLLAVQIKP